MDALERSARAITAREEVSGTSVVDDEAVGRDPTTAPAPLRVPRAMGGVRWPPSRPRRRRPCLPGDGGACCTPRVRRAPVCVSRPGDVAPVTINGAHRRPPARLRSRPWGSRPVRVPRTLHHRPPLPPLGESAVVDEVVLLVVIPPSPRFALPGLDAGVVGQSVTRFLPGSRRPAGTAPGPKRVGRPWSGPAAAPPPRSEPARTPRPGRESLRSPPSQSELQPLPGEPPSGSLTGTATTPGDAPRRPPIREIAG